MSPLPAEDVLSMQAQLVASLVKGEYNSGLSAASFRRVARNAGLGTAAQRCAPVVAPCAFLDLVISFRGRRVGNLVLWCSEVDLS